MCRYSKPTGPAHADLLQVFVLDVVEVWQARDVKIVPDEQEILLQLHLHQQLQEPLCAFFTLHTTAQLLEGETQENPVNVPLKGATH